MQIRSHDTPLPLKQHNTQRLGFLHAVGLQGCRPSVRNILMDSFFREFGRGEELKPGLDRRGAYAAYGGDREGNFFHVQTGPGKNPTGVDLLVESLLQWLITDALSSNNNTIHVRDTDKPGMKVYDNNSGDEIYVTKVEGSETFSACGITRFQGDWGAMNAYTTSSGRYLPHG